VRLMRRLLALPAAMILAMAALAQLPVEPHPRQLELLESSDPTLAANKRLVFDFWRVVMEAHDVDRAPEFLAATYDEHDPNLPNGRDALLRRLGRLAKKPVAPTIPDLALLTAEGDLVVLGFRREIPDLANEGQTYTTLGFEVFRVADGKIAAHWSSAVKE